MAESIDLIIEFTEPLEFSDLQLDHKTRLSVERLLEILGEAANHISQELKDSHPDVPWRQITDLRNIVSHQYFRIRLETIWEVANNEVPPLKKQIQQILFDLEHASNDD